MDGVLPVPTDGQLLCEYARTGSQGAFRELVSRHIDWVHSAAARQVRDPHLAEDVTQSVFILLARKAGAFDERVVLSAWLFRAVRYTSADALKARRRRRHHERELGAAMTGAHDRAAGGSAAAAPKPDRPWDDVAPELDAAIARLGARERAAILLRFYERKTLSQVGAAMGVSEDAAKMRVSRAVEKLRATLTRRGVALTAGTLASAIAGNAVRAAPGQLSASAVASAATAAAAGGSATAGGAAVVTLSWTKGLVLAMTIGKTSVAVVAACVFLAVLVTGVIVYQGTSATPTAGWTIGRASDTKPAPPPSGDMLGIYALSPGQPVKRVAAPFGSARSEYIKTSLRPRMQPGMVAKEDPTAVIFEWREGNADPLDLRGWQNVVTPTLRYVLTSALKAPEWECHGPAGLMDTVVEGDWVFRDTATPAERAAAIARVLRDEMGLAVRIERKRVNVESIVVAGGNMNVPAGGVQIYSDKMTPGDQLPGREELAFADMLDMLSRILDRRVANESATTAKTKVRYVLHGSALMGKMSPARNAVKLDLICRNLSRQTGLQFTRVQRQVEAWVVTPEK